MIRCRSLLLALLFTFASRAVAGPDDAGPFSAVCRDTRVEAYRYETAIDGKVITDEWSKHERFGSNWRFEYNGGKHVLVDGKLVPIVARKGPVLTLASPSAAALGAGIWVYVIHIELRAIVAAQVNGHSGLGKGVKTRAVELDCKFQVGK